jgi:flagellar motor component MotA
MGNDILQQENRHLRERLQAVESRQRQARRALDAFREHMLAAGMTAPIIDIAALLGELDCIRARLSGEVHP